MISGLVIHLATDEALANAATLAMERRPGLDLGVRVGYRLPVVAESTEHASVEEITDWLKDLNGVEHVDVAYVHLGDDLP